jgi:hypothetical protein
MSYFIFLKNINFLSKSSNDSSQLVDKNLRTIGKTKQQHFIAIVQESV